MRCASHQVEIDTSGFAAPVGTPAKVTATVTCVVDLSDLAFPECRDAHDHRHHVFTDRHLPGALTEVKTPSGADDERGSISLWLVTTGFTMIVLVGLAIDLAARSNRNSTAYAVAGEAPGPADNSWRPPRRPRPRRHRQPRPGRRGRPRLPGRLRCLNGTVQVSGGTTVIVHVGDLPTKFLGIIGITSMTVTGHAQSRIVRAVNGVER